MLQTIHNPAIQETDPRFGVEAALSEFDAQFRSHTFFEKNNRVFNNQFFGGGVQRFTQDLHDHQTQLSKQTASGKQFFLRHNVDYDANNRTGNLFGSAWNANFETEIRQPLLQGAGSRFNRIAGPATTSNGKRDVIYE
ncbi:MAG TPA: hypothetical protein VMM56_05995 [Planctomycetaceae bacterium]|nr:hypothetical protein [Planctomycetaceae bacterium]